MCSGSSSSSLHIYLAPLPLLSVQAPASPAMTSLVSHWEVPATELVRCGGPSAALLKNDGSFEFPLGFEECGSSVIVYVARAARWGDSQCALPHCQWCLGQIWGGPEHWVFWLSCHVAVSVHLLLQFLCTWLCSVSGHMLSQFLLLSVPLLQSKQIFAK